MAITANKCFGTVKRLKTVEPKLFCRALAEFPADLKRAKVALPSADEADFENMPYDDLAAMVLKGEMSNELEELLFNLGSLGNADGWSNVVKEARYWGHMIDESLPGHSYSGCVLAAWLNDWPNNKELLEKAMARMQLYKLSSCVYFPMEADVRQEYRKPSDEDVRGLVWYSLPWSRARLMTDLISTFARIHSAQPLTAAFCRKASFRSRPLLTMAKRLLAVFSGSILLT